MFQSTSYVFLLLTTTTGLLGLVGSVGIFVSLIIQRRIEKLQDILEQLLDLSLEKEKNFSRHIFHLIQKYQMHYLLPQTPIKSIIFYVNATAAAVITIWLIILTLAYQGPPSWKGLLLLLPPAVSTTVLLTFRRLLQNTINPLRTPLFNAIIPPPEKLRSISFLSTFINVSIIDLLFQARLEAAVENTKKGYARVLLKEELSFDDFFYYFQLLDNNKTILVSCGEIMLYLEPDHLTKKPVPLQRNINIPIGYFPWGKITKETIYAHLLIFARGEKHPLGYRFQLTQEESYFLQSVTAVPQVEQKILYGIVKGQLHIYQGRTYYPFLAKCTPYFQNNGQRYWLIPGKEPVLCKETPYVQ